MFKEKLGSAHWLQLQRELQKFSSLKQNRETFCQIIHENEGSFSKWKAKNSKKIHETKDFHLNPVVRRLTSIDLSVDYFFKPALYHLSSDSNRKQEPKHICTSGPFPLASHLPEKECGYWGCGDGCCMQQHDLRWGQFLILGRAIILKARQ